MGHRRPLTMYPDMDILDRNHQGEMFCGLGPLVGEKYPDRNGIAFFSRVRRRDTHRVLLFEESAGIHRLLLFCEFHGADKHRRDYLPGVPGPCFFQTPKAR